jgi:predicted amidohydrolase
MKVGVVQLHPAFGDVEGNLEKVMERVSSEDAELFVLPELVLSGYVFESREEAASLAQEAGSSVFEPLSELAARKGASIVIGFAELCGDLLYNSSMLLTSEGGRSVYRKIQLFCDERSIFEPGDSPPHVVEVDGVRLGMMVCFDWIFPEVARTLALSGADILCHSANLVLPYCQDAMVTRCIENRVFALTANRVGTEERGGSSFTFTGRSQIVAPNGKILARAEVEGERVLVAEIDPSMARNKSVTDVNDVFSDRRPELYRLD